MNKEENATAGHSEEELPKQSDHNATDQEELTEEQKNDKNQAEDTDFKDKYLRLYAEFDNFKRRTTKERIELLQTASKDVLVALLPVLDDFERSLQSIQTASNLDAVKEGVSLVHNKLKNILTQKGLKEMEAISQPFDPEIHEAITNVPAPTDDLKGKIIDQVEKGYYLNNKVIRYAKVVVGN
jgi:molecular chaperone GrpE